MGFESGRIVLNNNNNTYYPGETIYGKLEFEQSNVKTFRGIYVKIEGFAHVDWKTQHTRYVDGKSMDCTVAHDAHEDYFSMKKYLVGGEFGEIRLQPGNYSFDFECLIPPHCPSSFEHEYGHIRYELKVVVDRPFRFDQEKKMSLRVISPLDLNKDPYCKEPMVFSLEDTYCCCCLTAGYCETIVKLPVGGYCPGQIIPVELHCSNKSSVEVVKIKLAIVKKMRFSANSNIDRKYDSEQIIEVMKGPVNEFTTRNWTVEMQIPYIVIHNVDACRIIDIEYEFMVSVVTDGCHSDSADAQRIVLGTVPLVGYQDNMPDLHQEQRPLVLAVGNRTTTQSQILNYGNGTAANSMPNPPYPITQAPYPPAGPVNPGAVSTNPPYPTANIATNPPYPTANISNPSASPYIPIVPPYQIAPYPPMNPPYPNTSSDPKVNLPYPIAPPPYPVTNDPYPNPNPAIGFRVQGVEVTRSLSPMAETNNIVAPSAPEPSTPDNDEKTIGPGYNQENRNTSNYTYPYNPQFMSRNK